MLNFNFLEHFRYGVHEPQTETLDTVHLTKSPKRDNIYKSFS